MLAPFPPLIASATSFAAPASLFLSVLTGPPIQSVFPSCCKPHVVFPHFNVHFPLRQLPSLKKKIVKNQEGDVTSTISRSVTPAGSPSAPRSTDASSLGQQSAPPPALIVTSGGLLRSPSHESVTTDLSLFSVSSVSSGRRPHHLLRGPSPPPPSRPADIPELLWFDEEVEVVRGCGLLSSALGLLPKSFSTSDISQLPSSPTSGPIEILRSTVSDIALSRNQRVSYMWGGGSTAACGGDGNCCGVGRLDAGSRSCSTWVAVGDVPSASQLPSPHGRPSPPDLVRSANRKVRQNYIRRRLMTTYKALERLSQSEFNLDRLEAAAVAAACPSNRLSVPGPTVLRTKGKGVPNLSLTVSDVERERGRPLSKYDRNMMIFNWLHTLDEPEDAPPI